MFKLLNNKIIYLRVYLTLSTFFVTFEAAWSSRMAMLNLRGTHEQWDGQPELQQWHDAERPIHVRPECSLVRCDIWYRAHEHTVTKMACTCQQNVKGYISNITHRDERSRKRAKEQVTKRHGDRNYSINVPVLELVRCCDVQRSANILPPRCRYIGCITIGCKLEMSEAETEPGITTGCLVWKNYNPWNRAGTTLITP